MPRGRVSVPAGRLATARACLIEHGYLKPVRRAGEDTPLYFDGGDIDRGES
jgi:hypothetical protein